LGTVATRYAEAPSAIRSIAGASHPLAGHVGFEANAIGPSRSNPEIADKMITICCAR
jgi:hypothetical protein